MSAETAAAVNAQSDEELEPDLDFDVPLGGSQGIIAYSNLDDYYFSGERAYCAGVYTGYKYQCVEFSRRYMLLRYGCIFGQCGPAAEIFAMTTVENVETGETLPFIACKNGETKVKPAVGMTIIYPIDKKMPVGHVCTISYVGDGVVGIAEQNQESKSWKGKPYGRLVPISCDPETGAWTMKETLTNIVDCSGWLYIEGYEKLERKLADGVTEEQQSSLDYLVHNPIPYADLKVKEQFIAPLSTEKHLARFDTPVAKPKIMPETLSTAASTEAKRHALGNLYVKTLEEHFAKHVGENDHHHIIQTRPRPRAATKRTPALGSIYSPNESLGVQSIGVVARAFKLVEACVKDMLAGFADKPEDDPELVALAHKYVLPPRFLKAAAKLISTATAASSALSAADFVLGSLGLVFDPSTDSYRILHTEFDSANFLIDIHLLQDEYSQDHGLAQGWRMTSFGNDFHRAVRNIQQFRLGIRNADTNLMFVDFGSIEDLAARGIKLDEEAAYLYEIERWNSLYMVEYLIEFLESKREDVKNGDLLLEDAPHWTIEKATFFDDAVVSVDAAKKSLKVNGNEVRLMWKMAPWSVLFDMAGQNEKLTSFMDSVALTPSVMQPLWTHVVQDPHFLRHLSTWAAEKDRKAENGDSASLYTIPVEDWVEADDADGRPICKFKVPVFAGVTDPENPMRQPPREGRPAPQENVKPTKKYFPGIHSLVVGGKRSASVMVEARSGTDSDTCSIYDLVHPAPLSYMPFIKHTPDAKPYE